MTSARQYYLGLLLVALMALQAQAAESTLKKDVLLWYDAFTTKDPALLDRILSPQWVDIPAPPGEPAGRKARKTFSSSSLPPFLT
jgi:hypothetical protein